MKLVHTSINALVAGALGGALVGLAESALVSATSGAADEYWLFAFGVATYGLFGAFLGLGAGLAWQLLRWGRASERAVLQAAVAAGVAIPALAVARYHVAQRIFKEELVTASTAGIITHLLLVAGAAVVAIAAALIVRTLYRFLGALGPLVALVTAAVVAGLIGALGGAPPKAANRPVAAADDRKANIILIVADTLRADAVDKVKDRPEAKSGFGMLAEDGIVFERAYSQSSWTRPSIATILTSQYPSAHGTVHKMDFLPDAAVTMAESLRQEGYWTAAFTTNINVAPVFNFQQGFDEFRYLEPSFYFWATDSATKLASYKVLRVLHERFFSDRMYFEHYYQDAAVVDRNVEAWLGAKPPQPFFLFVHYMDPHDPYFEMPYNGRGVARVTTPDPAPERAGELHDLYLQGVRYLDAYLHELFERLQSTGLYDRTLIALTADHGEEFHEHGGWWHGTSLYQEQVHVPLLIKQPGQAAKGTRRTDTARSIDIGATLMAGVGLDVPPSFMGIDLFSERVSEPLLAEEDLEGNRLTSIRAGEWKLITANAGNPRGLAPIELYNLTDDPGETRNVASTQSDRVTDLLAQLESLRTRIAEHGRGVVGTAESDAADPRT